MSTSSKKPSRQPPKQSSKSTSRTPKSSKGDRSQEEQTESTSEWSEWQWNAQWSCYHRCRQKADGSWEDEYSQLGENTPRTLNSDNTSTREVEGSLREGDEYTTNPISTTQFQTTSRFIPETSSSELADSRQQRSAPTSRLEQGVDPIPESQETITQGVANLGWGRADTSEAIGSDTPTGFMTDNVGTPTSQSQLSGYYNQSRPPTGTSYLGGLSSPALMPQPTGTLGWRAPFTTTSAPAGIIPSSYTIQIPTNAEGQLSTIPLSPNTTGSTEADERKINTARTINEPGLHPENTKYILRGNFSMGKVLWTEPSGQAGAVPKGTDRIPTKYGEESYASIRRFVIVAAHEGHCLCLPILTYGRQATKKKGVKPQDHAIVYTEGGKKSQNKAEKPTEVEGEEKLSKKPIRIDPRTARDQLDKLSRLNYAKIYTVEYNVKVYFIGSVHAKSRKYFARGYNTTHPTLPEEPNTEFSEEDNE